MTGFGIVYFACKDDPAKTDAKDDAKKPPVAQNEPDKAAVPLKAIDKSTTATVSGTISFTGTLPEPTHILANADAACAAAHKGEFDAGDVRVSKDGKVEAAFVWVKSGLEGYRFDPPVGPVKVDQKGCMYNPRILAARVNQDIEFTNSDPTLHNIASKPAKQQGWNFVTPQGQSGARTFKKPEVMVKVGCDVHPWMRAWIGVLDHPIFAITGEDGKFALKGLPPGTYVIGAWHERLGASEQSVTVAAKESKTLDFTLGEKK